jgi:hypothetical protein
MVAEALGELADVLARAGCELIILEMMYHPTRMRLALDAALATGLPVWCGLSARRAAGGGLLSFLQTEDLPFDAVARLVPPRGIDAAGLMHSGAELIAPGLHEVRRHLDRCRGPDPRRLLRPRRRACAGSGARPRRRRKPLRPLRAHRLAEIAFALM